VIFKLFVLEIFMEQDYKFLEQYFKNRISEMPKIYLDTSFLE